MTDATASGSGKMRALTASELAELLAGPLIARLACVTPDNAPYVVPLWQEWDGQSMWFIVRCHALFVPYLQANPRTAVSCALERSPGTRALLEGLSEFVAGPVPLDGEMLAMGRRMANRYMGERGPEYLERTRDRPRYWLRLTPQRITSWEGGEWAARYRI